MNKDSIFKMWFSTAANSDNQASHLALGPVDSSEYICQNILILDVLQPKQYFLPGWPASNGASSLMTLQSGQNAMKMWRISKDGFEDSTFNNPLNRKLEEDNEISISGANLRTRFRVLFELDADLSEGKWWLITLLWVYFF